jgi:hypothetical protein
MNLCNFSRSKFLFYTNFKHVGTQEIIVILIVAAALIYVVYRIIKKSKDHDCDKCNH